MAMITTQQAQGTRPVEALTGLIGQLELPELRTLQGLLEQRIRQQEQGQGSSGMEASGITPAVSPAVAEQADESPLARRAAERGQRMVAEAENNQPAIQSAFANLLVQWGLAADPVSPAALREMMRKCGVREEDNLFSRGLIDLREE